MNHTHDLSEFKLLDVIFNLSIQKNISYKNIV